MNDNDYLLAQTTNKLAENILKRPVPPNYDLNKLKFDNIIGQKRRKNSARKQVKKSPRRHKRNSSNIDQYELNIS